MVARKRGAVAGEALLIALGVSVLWHDLQSAEFVLSCAIALAAAAPLLLGAAMARRRMIGCAIPTIEQHR